ncbi:unnamed protein product [Effrenium voratum]|uniref:Fatty acid hydroxylase domain-containing protein n=1 Tax=Effrenium voratum TaxID=2562239 RepID=A0AA36J2W8_9DINO|nr:unnamed protein product [Effrenium voratum]CAJ1423886.1 unnamed protein product [Effrenium voratum]
MDSQIFEAGRYLSYGFRCLLYMLPPKELALVDGDRVPNLIASHGIVMFFVLMGAEFVAGQFVQRKLYRFNDFLSCIASGTFQQLCIEWLHRVANPKSCYKMVNSLVSQNMVDVKKRPIFSWTCLMLGTDLAYYWAHRSLHVFHAGWASHSVHHSGEDYNLATALRQGALQNMMTWIFSLPLALCFPAESILIHSQLNTLYQFWVHTELCGRLGILEFVLNSPFHHRMHHRPPGNCNYAGVLIIWDRLFKTYKCETERLDYFGLAQPAGTFDALELNLQHWRKMGRFSVLRGGCFWNVLRTSLVIRAHHELGVAPWSLWEPFEEMKTGSSWSLPTSPTRPKYQGASMDWMGRAAAVGMFLGSFLCLRRADKSETLAQLSCCVGGGLMWTCALGKFLDTGAYDAACASRLLAAASLTAADIGFGAAAAK